MNLSYSLSATTQAAQPHFPSHTLLLQRMNTITLEDPQLLDLPELLLHCCLSPFSFLPAIPQPQLGYRPTTPPRRQCNPPVRQAAHVADQPVNRSPSAPPHQSLRPPAATTLALKTMQPTSEGWQAAHVADQPVNRSRKQGERLRGWRRELAQLHQLGRRAAAAACAANQGPYEVYRESMRVADGTGRRSCTAPRVGCYCKSC